MEGWKVKDTPVYLGVKQNCALPQNGFSRQLAYILTVLSFGF
jgi:glutaredoxin-related protein